MNERAALCVDDEVHILNSLKRLLRSEGYKLLTATSGREGLTVLEGHPVQVVISDQRMPGITGVEFLQAVKELYPDTVRVVLSGYADVGHIVDSINKGQVFRFLPKPWNDEELKTSIRQCFMQYDILQENRVLMGQIREQNEELRRLNEDLEEIVSSRTQSLRLSQEILENIRLPVLGISREGMLVVANQAVRSLFPSIRKAPPGTDMRRVLPPAVADAVTRCLGGDGPRGLPPFDWYGRSVCAHVEPLKNRDGLRGCVLTLEVAGDE